MQGNDFACLMHAGPTCNLVEGLVDLSNQFTKAKD